MLDNEIDDILGDFMVMNTGEDSVIMHIAAVQEDKADIKALIRKEQETLLERVTKLLTPETRAKAFQETGAVDDDFNKGYDYAMDIIAYELTTLREG